MEDRIIVAKFGRGNTCRTAPQFRLNRGQILQFEGIELPSLYQAHFSNSPYGEAKTVIGDSTGVQIPQEYFVPGKEIYVWIYVNTEDYGITKYQITIPVCPRADISDQQPDPEEQTVIDQAIALLNDTNEHVQDRIDASLAAAKASGEFDGVDGSTIWTYISTPITPNYTFYKYLLRGTAGAVPKVEDLIIMGNDMYKIASIGEYTVLADYYLRLKGTDGRDGVSPTMTVTKRTVEFGTVDRYIISITDTNGTREYNVDTPTALMINLIASECIERNIYTFNGLLDTDEPWSLYIRTGPSLSDDTFWDRVSHFSNPAMVTLVFNSWGVGLVDSPRIEAPLTSVAEAGDSRSLSFETLLYDDDGRLVLIRLSINYNGEVQTTSVSHEYLETLLGTIPGVVYFDQEQELSDFEKSIARENIGAASIEDLGTVFDIKGEVATASDLPASGNRVGDVYYVVDQSVAYVWLETNEHPNGYWEEFGAPIDLSGYATKTELNNKVDKVTGKGLSTNDYSTAEKSKLASIAEGAQVNAIERIKKNGVALPINLKAVDITVPEKTSDLTNDSNFAEVDDTLSVSGKAADAKVTGGIKAVSDRVSTETLAMWPEIGADAFSWIYGSYINTSGALRTNKTNYARSNLFPAKTGDVVQNLCPAIVSVGGVSKNTVCVLHEYSSGTGFDNRSKWLRRTVVVAGGSATVGENTNCIQFVYGLDDESIVLANNKTLLTDNFAVRIAKASAEAQDVDELMPQAFPSELDMPLAVCHRGLASADSTGNTIAAYEDAIAKGWKYLECDIRHTSDDVWVLHHDANISGTNIAEMTYAQAIAADANLAKLEDFLLLCRRALVTPVVENKIGSSTTNEEVDAVWALAKNCGMEKEIIWLCSSFGGVERLLELNPFASVIQTSATEWNGVDMSDPSSLSRPDAYNFKTGKNKVFHQRLVSSVASGQMDNLVDYYHYWGIYCGVYGPTTQAGVDALSERLDIATTEVYPYTKEPRQTGGGVSSVNGQTGAVTLSIPSTAGDVGAVAANQGAANANKVLKVGSDGTVSPEDNRFVVTLTPTAQDFSGVMDKAVSEIYAANQTGKKIIFRLMLSATTAYETECTARYDAGLAYPSFNAFAVVNGPPIGDAIIYFFTGARDSDSYGYAISIYPLATGQWTGGSY